MAEAEAPDIAASALSQANASGYLEKKRPDKKMMSVKYHRRWCVIQNGFFYYYEKPTDKKQRGSFHLDGFVFASSATNPLVFSLNKFGKRGYEFMASSLQEFTKWRHAITQACMQVDKSLEDLMERTHLATRSEKQLKVAGLRRKPESDRSNSLPRNLTLGSQTRRMKPKLSPTSSLPETGNYRNEYCPDYVNLSADKRKKDRNRKPPKIGVINKNSVEEEDESSDEDYIDVSKEQSIPEKKHSKHISLQKPSPRDEQNFYQNLPFQLVNKHEEEDDNEYLEF